MRSWLVTVLATLLFGCRTVSTPATTRLSLPHEKDRVFQAALITLQQWGEDILTADQNGGLLATRPRDWWVSEEIRLNYRMTITIRALPEGTTDIKVNVSGEKYFQSDGSVIGVDESDYDLRGIIEGILGGTQQNLNLL